MAPKPERARLAFAFGMVLVMAVTILAILTWTRRDLAAPIPPTEPIYQPQHLILYFSHRPMLMSSWLVFTLGAIWLVMSRQLKH